MTTKPDTLVAVAKSLTVSGKGILAADESTGTMEKRLSSISVPSTEQNRRDYRELLFRTEEAMSHYISGVILFDETLRQNAADGTPLVSLIKKAGSCSGIKVDKGAKPLAGAPGETVTEGLDGLRERLEEYTTLGAQFAKWRATYTIGLSLPTSTAISANAHALARYAALCQEAGIVPIVEPEVLMDGDHDINRCLEVTEAVLHSVYEALNNQNVLLEGTLLKPNMVLSGSDCKTQASVEEVAQATLSCLQRAVPKSVSGIAFLSGGQSDKAATAHLNAMNALGNASWPLTFSYGRALQAAPLKAWAGKSENKSAAQSAFAHRAQMNSLATQGRWQAAMEQDTA
ncbi:MAG: class I fructose-bisphosphate aldolase [Parvularculales bacterium]